jgi:hypothetical protein
MGSQSFAFCNCGLRATTLIGGGFSDFQENCRFPALCRGCNQVVEVNLLKPPLSCPECTSREVIPYTDPTLAKGDGDGEVITWGDHNLTNGHYQCPACGQFTLRFRPGGLHWD